MNSVRKVFVEAGLQPGAFPFVESSLRDIFLDHLLLAVSRASP
jgi:hypothetical protein